MGRSSGDFGGLDPDGFEPLDSAGAPTDGLTKRAFKAAQTVHRQMLEQVRRALGRLVTHTTVNEFPIAAISPYAALAPWNPLSIELPPEPAGDDRLYIPVSDHPAGIPEADPGGGGVDLAAVATVVSANSALGESSVESYPVAVDYTEARAIEIPTWVWSVQEPGMSALDTTPMGGDVHAFSLDRVHAAAVGALPIDPVRAVAGTKRSIADALRTMRITVHSSFSHAYRAPMRRRSAIVRRGPGLNGAERERLAAAAKTSLENVALIGLFRNVPVTAVSRLSVEEDTAELSIWLKPEAVGANIPPLMVSLLIGRDTTTGKMIQTVAN